MAQKKTYNLHDIVGLKDDPSVLGKVMSVEHGKYGLEYQVDFFKVDEPGEYTSKGYDASELTNKNSQPYRKAFDKLNTGPNGGSRKSRRSRKNRRTRRVRR